MNFPRSHILKARSVNDHGGDPGSTAFTLVELLVVIAISGILAVMMLPALASTRLNNQAIQCMDNHKRLATAWLQFATDHNDYLAPNGTTTVVGLPAYWCAGVMAWSTWADNTNAALMIDPKASAMGSYMESPRVFKCPSDKYQSPVNPGPRVRSVAMNAALGGSPDLSQQQDPDRKYIKVTKLAQLIKPGLAQTFVTLDEHPDSINDSVFHMVPGLLPPSAVLRDMPASYHNKGCNFSFADGHSEIHRWLDSRTKQDVRMVFKWWGPGNLSVPNSVDYQWLIDRMPYESL